MNGLHTLYTAGYTGTKPHELLRLARVLDATIVDVRLSPRSRHPQWSKKQLTLLLGDRYEHVGELGNRNYKGQYPGGIQLADPDRGCNVVVKILAKRSAILLCACLDYRECHRTNAAQEIADRYGVEVVHLSQHDILTIGLPPIPTQPALF